jgi:predicted homoserine dehydrogenase-like protein
MRPVSEPRKSSGERNVINLFSKLEARSEPIDVGVIGAGLFGTNLMDQIARTPGMRTAAVADLDLDTARDALAEAGESDRVIAVDGEAAIDDAIADGSIALTDDALALIGSTVDVVVEATGVPDAGARHAYNAISEGKHVVMVTVETDTVVGPILSELASNAGVTYSFAYGDQPALIVELYDWARTVGLDVVAVGKGNTYREEFRLGTPDDVFERLGFDEEFVAEHGLNPRMYNSFIDGTKVAVEMCAVANALDLDVDTPGMHFPTCEVPEIPNELRPAEDGGLLSDTGVVETVSTLYPDGTSVDHGIGFGVFVVTTTPNNAIAEYIEQNSGEGFYVSDDGEYQVFYRPHHLPGVETTVSVASAAIHNEPTGTSRTHSAEVVAAAKRDLAPGDEIDGGGGYTVYGRLGSASRAAQDNHVPFELLHGAEVVNPVAQDEVVTYDDVALDEDSFIYSLRALQDERFSTE